MAKRRMLKVNFKDVESSGRIRIPEDDYKFKCVANKQDESKDGNPMVVWDWEIIEGKQKGKVVRDYAPLSSKGLWKLKSILEAMGVTVPNRAVNINLDKYLGEEVGGTVTDDEYGGRISSKISDYFTVDALDENGDEEDLEDEDDEEEEDEDEEEGDELDEMDRSELKAYIKENELDVSVKKSMDDDAIREAIREADEEEDDDEDEEDDEPEPAPRKKAGKKGSKKGKKAAASDDDEEIEEIDLDEL
jgi:hypothetical protein